MTVVPYDAALSVRDNSTGYAADWLLDPAEIARVIGNTDFVPKGLRGNAAAITAALLYGAELGLGRMQSLSKIAVIDGRPTLAAEAQRALILAAGHDLWIEEATVTRCTLAGRRRGGENVTRVTWTLDDAKRARIAGKPNWQAYPRQMLLARATAELARAVFADAIGGLAATEEFEDDTEAAPPLAALPEPSGEAEKAPTRRRRRSVPPPPTPDPPEPVPPPEPPPADPPTRAQLGQLFALFTEKGYEARERRLEYTEHLLGRKVETSKELSGLDVSRLIDALREEPTPTNTPAQEAAVEQALRDELDAREVEPGGGFEQPPLPGE